MCRSIASAWLGEFPNYLNPLLNLLNTVLERPDRAMALDKRQKFLCFSYPGSVFQLPNDVYQHIYQDRIRERGAVYRAQALNGVSQGSHRPVDSAFCNRKRTLMLITEQYALRIQNCLRFFDLIQQRKADDCLLSSLSQPLNSTVFVGNISGSKYRSYRTKCLNPCCSDLLSFDGKHQHVDGSKYQYHSRHRAVPSKTIVEGFVPHLAVLYGSTQPVRHLAWGGCR